MYESGIRRFDRVDDESNDEAVWHFSRLVHRPRSLMTRAIVCDLQLNLQSATMSLVLPSTHDLSKTVR